MLALQIEHDRVLIGERFNVSFQRTLRIPDDGKAYPLPPGLDNFPVKAVADYAGRLPAGWEPQGVFIPMYQREALWLAFGAAPWKPNAVKVGAGRINALTGEPWDEDLHTDPQDYLVCPDQPWLDGFNSGDGFVRQFVAMPLGMGYTAEGQLSGREQFGGLQILVFEPVAGRFPDQPPPEPEPDLSGRFEAVLESAPGAEMGLGAGGQLQQKIYPDKYGLDTWDPENFGSLNVYILNSQQYQEMTGEPAPPTPVDPQTYQKYNLPWFDLYDEEAGALPGSENLDRVKSVREKDAEHGVPAGEDEKPIDVRPDQVKKIDRRGKRK